MRLPGRITANIVRGVTGLLDGATRSADAARGRAAARATLPPVGVFLLGAVLGTLAHLLLGAGQWVVPAVCVAVALVLEGLLGGARPVRR